MIRHELVRILRKFFSLKTHMHGNITNDGKISDSGGKIITTGEHGELQASAYISKNQISDFPQSMPPSSHTHTKSQITDFTHTHNKNEISDFTHTHNKNEITNFSHAHGDISHEGKITTADSGTVKKAVIIDNNDNIKTITKIPFANLNITKNNITGLGIPATDTNTTYSAGRGLSLNGTTFNINEADASDIIHSTENTPLPNILPDTQGGYLEVPQSIINSLFDSHTHLNQWEEITVPKGTLFVNKKLGLAEYIYDGTFNFPTSNTDVAFHTAPVIPSQYTPVYRLTELIHNATSGLTVASLYSSGRIVCRSYSATSKGISMHFLYRYRKAGENDIPSIISL